METQKRNTFLLSLSLAFVIIAGAIIMGVVLYNKNKQYNQLAQLRQELENANQDLSTQLNSRDSVINDMLTGFDEIATNLESIRQRRSLINTKTDEGALTEDKKQAIVKDIQMMNSLLDDSKMKIAQLNAKLKSSGLQTVELQQKIEALNKIVEVQSSDIAALKETLTQKDFQMAELNEKMDNLEMNLVAKKDTIIMQHNDLNRAYYAHGTYKELKEKGLLAKEGGFLFLGKNTNIQENFDGKYFTEIDILKVKTIPVNSKKAELITEHPAGSYKLVEDNGKIAYLQIENPQEFWKISKYAVVETK